MADILTITEIEARFPSEWVLIDQPQKDEGEQLVGGIVVCHSKDPDEVYRHANAMPAPIRIAIHFTGPPDPDMEFML